MSGNASYAESFFRRLRGLMFTEPSDMILVSPEETLEHASIHMFFMRYPIDVVWVDSESIVVDVKKGVPPSSILNPKSWRIIKPKSPARYVVELGAGDAGETQIGDRIVFS